MLEEYGASILLESAASLHGRDISQQDGMSVIAQLPLLIKCYYAVNVRLHVVLTTT